MCLDILISCVSNFRQRNVLEEADSSSGKIWIPMGVQEIMILARKEKTNERRYG